MNNSERRYYDKDGKHIKSVFTIPVGGLSAEQAEEEIKNLNKSYKEYEYGDYWFPVKDENTFDITNIENK